MLFNKENNIQTENYVKKTKIVFEVHNEKLYVRVNKLVVHNV